MPIKYSEADLIGFKCNIDALMLCLYRIAVHAPAAMHQMKG